MKRLVYLDPMPHSCIYTSQIAFSGYNQLISHVQNSRLFDLKIYEWCQAFGYLPGHDVNRSRIHLVLPRGVPFLTQGIYNCPMGEIQAWLQKANIIHHINADNTFFLNGLIRRGRPEKLIATVHLPVESFIRMMPKFWPRLYNNLDTLITLSSREFRFFQAKLRKTNVVQIPHGNNNDRFMRSKLDPNIGLCIGGWLRDFGTLKKALRNLSQTHPDFKLYMISRRKPKDFQPPEEKNVIVKFNIPDQDLLRLYRNASMLILPLKDCTANNTVLEALASGIPIITNKVGGIPDYLDEKCAMFFKTGDVASLVSNISYLLDNEGEIKRISLAALEKAKNYDWKVISNKIINEIYLKN